MKRKFFSTTTRAHFAVSSLYNNNNYNKSNREGGDPTDHPPSPSMYITNWTNSTVAAYKIEYTYLLGNIPADGGWLIDVAAAFTDEQKIVQVERKR